MVDEKRARDLEKVEVGIEGATDALADRADAHEQHHVRRNAKRELVESCKQFGDDLSPGDLRATLETLDDQLEYSPDLDPIDRRIEDLECDEGVQEAVDVATDEGPVERRDIGLFVSREPLAHAVVVDDEPAVLSHREVAGVGVRVEDAVDESHLQVGAGDQRRHLGGAGTGIGQRALVGDLLALDVLHRDDALRTQVGIGVGDDDSIVVGEVVVDLGHDRRLAGEVEFLEDDVLEVAGEVLDRVALALVGDQQE